MNKLQKGVIITLVVGAALVFTFFVVTEAITKYTGFSVSAEENDFKECLNKNEITLFINTNDVVATLNNIQLRKDLSNFNIINCMQDNNLCIENKIAIFPSWVINNNKIDRDISLAELEELSGCKKI